MDFHQKKIVMDLLVDAAQKLLYTKLPNEKYLLYCTEITEKFSVEIVEQALKNWVAQDKGEGRLPVPLALVHECRLVKEKLHEKRNISPETRQCEYFSAKESHLSKRQCRRSLTVSEADSSRLIVNQIVCSWHQQCLIAKSDPVSVEAMFVKNLLRSAAQAEKNPDLSADFKNVPQNWASICLKNAIQGA